MMVCGFGVIIVFDCVQNAHDTWKARLTLNPVHAAYVGWHWSLEQNLISTSINQSFSHLLSLSLSLTHTHTLSLFLNLSLQISFSLSSLPLPRGVKCLPPQALSLLECCDIISLASPGKPVMSNSKRLLDKSSTNDADFPSNPDADDEAAPRQAISAFERQKVGRSSRNSRPGARGPFMVHCTDRAI